jgi:CHASE2 domain-containing sensor protein
MTQSRAPLIVAVVLLLVSVLYVGSYLALVVPGGIVVTPVVPPGFFNSPASYHSNQF